MRARKACHALFLLAPRVFAAQPGAPEPLAAPLRELEFGQVHFLHTTDTHGWHAGHLLEPSFSAPATSFDFAPRQDHTPSLSLVEENAIYFLLPG